MKISYTFSSKRAFTRVGAHKIVHAAWGLYCALYFFRLGPGDHSKADVEQIIMGTYDG